MGEGRKSAVKVSIGASGAFESGATGVMSWWLGTGGTSKVGAVRMAPASGGNRSASMESPSVCRETGKPRKGPREGVQTNLSTTHTHRSGVKPSETLSYSKRVSRQVGELDRRQLHATSDF